MQRVSRRSEYSSVAARKAVMDSEPVYQCQFYHTDASGELEFHWEDVNQDFYEQWDSKRRGDRRMLYRNTQPAPEREQVCREHSEWSQVTFGNVGPVGPLKHLSKEALEAAAEPGDLSERADMQFLLWNAQRRAGITDEQITRAMIEKLVVNKQREWPEPRDGEPRLHIRDKPDVR